jgi:hypothetical protein
MTHFLLVALTVGALAACHRAPPAEPASAAPAGPTPDSTATVTLTTDRTQLRAADRLQLTLRNQTPAIYAFNPCTRTVERQVGGGWEPVHEEGRMCTMEAWLLGGGETRTAETTLPPGLSPGTYRVALLLTPEAAASPPGGRVVVRSGSLVVVP